MDLFGKFGKPHVKSHEWVLALSHPRQTIHGTWQIWDREVSFRFQLFAMIYGLVHRWKIGGETHLRERTIYR